MFYNSQNATPLVVYSNSMDVQVTDGSSDFLFNLFFYFLPSFMKEIISKHC